jgi:hypothetical protein
MIGLKVGSRDVRGVPSDPSKALSVFESDRPPSAASHGVSQKSVLVAPPIAAARFQRPPIVTDNVGTETESHSPRNRRD